MEQREAFRVLASADRQLVLHELVEQNGVSTVDDLSRQVAARRHRIPPEKIDDKKIERAQIRLIHTHFPQLQERDIITVEWSDREVALTDEQYLNPLFEAAAELDSWPPNDLLEQPH